MKKRIIRVVFAICASVASADLVYDFTDKGSTFDGNTSVDIPLSEGGVDFTMTVTATSGGELNSNQSDFGIGNALLDEMDEVLTLTFSKPIHLIYIDLGGVGNQASLDWATLTAGSETAVDLYTEVAGFNGSTDVYTPASPIRVEITESIVLMAPNASSSFDLETISIQTVPEPMAASLIGMCGLLMLMVNRILRR